MGARTLHPHWRPHRRDATQPSGGLPAWSATALTVAASLSGDDALARLHCDRLGLPQAEADARLAGIGANSLRSHGARPLEVMARQLRNPLLILLVAAALTSFAVGERTGALIILVIIALSVGLGFFNEFRSELAVEALHSKLRHTALVLRDGKPTAIDVTQLVPGDIVRLAVGDVVPADLRLLQADGLECDEAMLTGESLPAEKSSDPVRTPESSLDLPSCAFMGTVVREGSGLGVVVSTGARTEFGAIALQLGERQPQTAFQLGLRDFSLLLVRVTVVLAGSILLINVLVGRSLLGSVLFALAIAVGLTPQLLPAIVTISLSTGAKRLAERSVLVKRLVSIEDLGNIVVLFTDKTGTLTEGAITYAAALDDEGKASDTVLRAGLLCNEATRSGSDLVGGNQLDRALWSAPRADELDVEDFKRLAAHPFDYQRRLASVLVEDAVGERQVIVKGAPEIVLSRCAGVVASAQTVLDEQFSAGSRVIAVATRDGDGRSSLGEQDERNLALLGFLTFVDRPKADAHEAIERLRRLGVEVKVITGDNDRVAQKVCADIGLQVRGTLTGNQLDDLDEARLAGVLAQTTIFARVTPEQKSRLIKAQRALGSTVGFLGDGVNDAVALHDADVGISVQTATDVAKDAADIVLLDKDLEILAGGVIEGRRIFANTIKYILMGTSSNFGNMFSAGGASLILSFLPMLPTQILLNNLLYDASELTIPTDNVDEEQLQRPAHWDTHFIRRFMLFFGPISSVFDFATFGIMIWVFNAHAPLFRSGWFVESLATQSLIIFAIRTRRTPFFSSRPSGPLTIATLICVAIGVALPFSPLAHVLGFTALPATFLAAVAAMTAVYLVLIEVGKRRFYRVRASGPTVARPVSERERWIAHRASRWSTHAPAQSAAAPAEPA
jgi:P-type Mg2+ transporter